MPKVPPEMTIPRCRSVTAALFTNSRILSIDEYPDESLDEHFVGMTGKVLNGQFRLNGVDFVCH